MNITSAKYCNIVDTDGNVEHANTSIKVVIEEETLFVPLVVGNRHYDEIMGQVEAGELTIQEAD